MKGRRIRRMMVEKREGYEKKKRKGRRDMNEEEEVCDRSKA